jgi:hypothetical protein
MKPETLQSLYYFAFSDTENTRKRGGSINIRSSGKNDFEVSRKEREPDVTDS